MRTYAERIKKAEIEINTGNFNSSGERHICLGYVNGMQEARRLTIDEVLQIIKHATMFGGENGNRLVSEKELIREIKKLGEVGE